MEFGIFTFQCKLCVYFAGHPGVAKLSAVLLLASAASVAGVRGEAADSGSEWRRADRRPDAGYVAPLVCGGRGCRTGEEKVPHVTQGILK